MRASREIFRFLFLIIFLIFAGCNYNTRTSQDDRKDPYFLRAMDQLEHRDYNGAYDSFTRALEKSPHNAAAHYEMGILCEDQRKDYISAIYHYRKYLSLKDGIESDRVIEDRVTACMRELVNQSGVTPSSPAYLMRIDKLQKEKQQAEDSVAKVLQEYERVRLSYQDLYQKYMQQQALIKQMQLGVKTNLTLPLPPPNVGVNQSLSSIRGLGESPQLMYQGMERTKVYQIRAGDTFQKIAKSLGIKTKDIKDLNPGVNPNRLQIGDEIVIPDR